MDLSEDDRESFAARGWHVLRGAVSPERVAALEAALDAVLPPAYYAYGNSGRVVEIPSVSRGAPGLLDFAHDSVIAEAAALLLGAETLRYFQDTVFVKPAGGGARVEWHQDFTYFSFLDRPAAVTLRLALTPCRRDNGCLRVVSGSHLWGLQRRLSFRDDAVADVLTVLSPERRAHVEAHHELVELWPGDVSVHHCLTLHGSADNVSGAPRKTLAVRLVDGEIRLDPTRLPSPELRAHFPLTPEGRLAESAFPIVHPKSR